jgi:hypothetical protein
MENNERMQENIKGFNHILRVAEILSKEKLGITKLSPSIRDLLMSYLEKWISFQMSKDLANF